MSSNTKNPVRVAAGLKATLARDNVSDEAKMNAQERLKEMGTTFILAIQNSILIIISGRDEATLTSSSFMSDYSHSHKALSDEATSDKAKAHAREILEAAGYTVTEHPNAEEHQVRVMAGYKAALHSTSILFTTRLYSCPIDPRVSDEAKQHATEYLKEHDAL
jgi:hypothetical protein